MCPKGEKYTNLLLSFKTEGIKGHRVKSASLLPCLTVMQFLSPWRQWCWHFLSPSRGISYMYKQSETPVLYKWSKLAYASLLPFGQIFTYQHISECIPHQCRASFSFLLSHSIQFYQCTPAICLGLYWTFRLFPMICYYKQTTLCVYHFACVQV